MHPMQNIAIKAVRRAASIIQRASNNLENLRSATKSYNNFVTEVDQAAEAAIIETIQSQYPTHGFLAEESQNQTQLGEQEYQWIIDPLDGTTNYMHGYPHYSVSIALMHKKQLVQGVVYDPIRNDLFVARRGQGAYLNDRRIRVANRGHLTGALLATGFPYADFSRLDEYVSTLKAMLQKTAGVRREGSAALDLCYVASGRVDGFWEFDLKPWDIAAGALIAQEAGAIVTDLEGEDTWLETGNIIAANPKILALMIKTFAETKEKSANSPTNAAESSS